MSQLARDTHAPEDVARRLEDLLNYVEQVVRLDERPVFRLGEYCLPSGQAFVFHQHQFHALPGVLHDQSDDDGPIWLTLQRLRRTNPPVPPETAGEWLANSSDPEETPLLREVIVKTVLEVVKNDLVAAGEVRPEDCAATMGREAAGRFDVRLRLEDRPQIAEAAREYIANEWLAWAETERPRRKSMSLYQKFFELAQLAEISADHPFEIVWGIGVSRWLKEGAEIDLPLIERLVEVEIDDDAGGEIRLRPRSVAAQVNLRPYEELKIDGAALAQDATRRLISEVDDEEGVSPFRTETFEPILRACQTRIDFEARYLPDFGSIEPGEPLPSADPNLSVSDRWVLFARRRSDNFLLNDLAELKKSVAAIDAFPDPAKTLVMGPGAEPPTPWQPLGPSIGGPIDIGRAPEPVDPIGDLFFPKPFNEEQEEIVRRLEKADGVVVQGPPGTGKTHTISNIICHYLALGRRVLVVSHGESALAVLRNQLPSEIRDLAISITTSERDGLKQVENAARMMQTIVQDLKETDQKKLIQDIESSIIHLRQRLQVVDGEIASIAEAQLSLVAGPNKRPAELAKSVVQLRDQFAWFTDRPSLFSINVLFDEVDIATLRAARQALGKRILHINARLPAIADLPDWAQVARWHDNIVRARALTERVQKENLLLRIASVEELQKADQALDALAKLLEIRNRTLETGWFVRLADSVIPLNEEPPFLAVVRDFIADAQALLDEHYAHLHRPVDVPESILSSTMAASIIERLAKGQKVFGFLSFGEKNLRPEIEKIRVADRLPTSEKEWARVRAHIQWRGDFAAINRRWQSLSLELGERRTDLTSAANLGWLVDELTSIVVDARAAFRSFEESLPCIFTNPVHARSIWAEAAKLSEVQAAIADAVASVRLSAVTTEIERIANLFDPEMSGNVGMFARQILEGQVGRTGVTADEVVHAWNVVLKGIDDIAKHREHFDTVRAISEMIAESGAPEWSRRIRSEPAEQGRDNLMPVDWKDAWDWAASEALLKSIDQRKRLRTLSEERIDLDHQVAKQFERLVRERSFYELGRLMAPPVRAALMAFVDALKRIGAGTGKGASRYRRTAREAMGNCYGAIPCWIMPSWRVAEQLPGELGSFDLVIMDEASQADIREVTTLLRGRKILVVGDDKQVSPTAAFIENAKIDQLERGYLRNQPYKTLLLPGSSLYDLAKVMFPDKFVMLREHFRCVEPIIRFSMQFYHPQPLIPLRVPTPSERLDPPLVDIYVPDGSRTGDKINKREAEVIVEEIRRTIDDPRIARIESLDRWRTIGVISLIGSKQAALIYRMLQEELGEEIYLRHRITCGDSATFQGNEKDIVFLSMVADQRNKQSQTAAHFAQRFNVALSRARDRMVLVRSVGLEELKPNDLKAKVIRHFVNPMGVEKRADGTPKAPMNSEGETNTELYARCDSDFEREVMRWLITRGYQVTPQVGSVGYSIDLVVQGTGERRLAIECDGDKYHGPERWADDMRRQRILERVGWRFWRCWASSFSLDPEGCMGELVETLERHGIKPMDGAPGLAVYVEHRTAMRKDGQGTLVDEIGATAEKPPVVEQSDGIREGDRIVVRYLDDQKLATYSLSSRPGDELNGVLSTSSSLGSRLIGAGEEDEVEFEVDGQVRRVIVVRTERPVQVLH